MRGLAVLFLSLLLALPAAAAAETELAQAGAIDDGQRDAIKDFFQKQQDNAAKPAQEKSAKDAKQKKSNKKTDKKAAQKKDKKADKKKDAKKDKTADKKKDKKKTDDKKKKTKQTKEAKGKDKDKAKNKTKETAKAQPALNLQPGGVLPSGAPRRALPKDLEAKLPKPASGQQRVIVGNDVVLIESKSGRVVDVMPGAVKGGR